MFQLGPSSLWHPIWAPIRKMTENNEQEVREHARSKHHSHGLKNQQLGYYNFRYFRDQEAKRATRSGHPLPSSGCSFKPNE